MTKTTKWAIVVAAILLVVTFTAHSSLGVPPKVTTGVVTDVFRTSRGMVPDNFRLTFNDGSTVYIDMYQFDIVRPSVGDTVQVTYQRQFYFDWKVSSVVIINRAINDQ